MRNTTSSIILKRVTSEAELKEGPGQPGTKKRVVTAARREQNKLAQRAWRQRQREQKKQLQNQFLKPAARPRKLEPKPVGDEECRRLSNPAPDSTSYNAEFGPGSGTQSQSLEPLPLIFQPTDIATQEDFQIPADGCPSSTLLPPHGDDDDDGSRAMTSLDPVLSTTSPYFSSSSSSSSSGELIDQYYLSIGRSLEDNRTAVLRACLTNALCIGLNIAELMFCEKPYISPFYQPATASNTNTNANNITGAGTGTGTHLFSPAAAVASVSPFYTTNFTTPITTSYESIPVNLRPTWAQVLIPHHASLDLIPLPKLRERAILASAALPHLFPQWEMKLDIYTRDALLLLSSSNRNSNRNIWGDAIPNTASQPWEKRSWKVAPWFLRKWNMVSVDMDEFKDVPNDNDGDENDDDEDETLAITGIPGLWM